MKRVIKLSLVAMFACVAGYGVYQSQKKVSLSALNLANIEALAQGEEAHKYEERVETVVEIWDNATQTYVKKISIDCQGKGFLDC